MHEKETSDKQPYARTYCTYGSFFSTYMVLHCVSVVHKKEKNSFFSGQQIHA